MKDKADAFCALELPHKRSDGTSASHYLVYKNDGSFVSVEADCAQSAIVASGVVKPVRVLRQSALVRHVLEQLPGEETPKPHRKEESVLPPPSMGDAMEPKAQGEEPAAVEDAPAAAAEAPTSGA